MKEFWYCFHTIIDKYMWIFYLIFIFISLVCAVVANEKIKSKKNISKYRYIIACLLLILIIARYVSGTGVDILQVILFAIFLLAVLKKDFIELLAAMPTIGLPAFYLPTKLDKQIKTIEEDYSNIIEHSIYQDLENILKTNPSIEIAIIEIKYLIKLELKKVFDKYNKDKKKSLNIKDLVSFLCDKNVIKSDFSDSIEEYLNVSKVKDEDEIKIWEIGYRILTLLKGIITHPESETKLRSKKLFKQRTKDKEKNTTTNRKQEKDTKVVLSGTETPEMGTIITVANLLDIEDNIFPLKNLTENNFKVTVITEGGEFESDIVSVEPLNYVYPIRITLVIDKSESMNNIVTENKTRLDLVKSATRNLLEGIRNIKNEVKLALIFFNSENIEPEFFNTTNNIKTIWSNNYIEILNKINNIEANYQTPLWEAIRNAIYTIRQEVGYKVIICLTDGENYFPKSNINFSDIEKLARQRDAIIYTIGYGKNIETLVQLSKITKAGKENVGSFMNITEYERLNDIFSSLSDSISHAYKIKWKTDIVERDIRKVKLQFTFSTVSGEIRQDEIIITD